MFPGKYHQNGGFSMAMLVLLNFGGVRIQETVQPTLVKAKCLQSGMDTEPDTSNEVRTCRCRLLWGKKTPGVVEFFLKKSRKNTEVLCASLDFLHFGSFSKIRMNWRVVNFFKSIICTLWVNASIFLVWKTKPFLYARFDQYMQPPDWLETKEKIGFRSTDVSDLCKPQLANGQPFNFWEYLFSRKSKV